MQTTFKELGSVNDLDLQMISRRILIFAILGN